MSSNAQQILSAAAPHIGWRIISEKSLNVETECGIETIGNHKLLATIKGCICPDCLANFVALAERNLMEMEMDLRKKTPLASAFDFNHLGKESK